MIRVLRNTQCSGDYNYIITSELANQCAPKSLFTEINKIKETKENVAQRGKKKKTKKKTLAASPFLDILNRPQVFIISFQLVDILCYIL